MLIGQWDMLRNNPIFFFLQHLIRSGQHQQARKFLINYSIYAIIQVFLMKKRKEKKKKKGWS
jgi:hypothetical protein